MWHIRQVFAAFIFAPQLFRGIPWMSQITSFISICIAVCIKDNLSIWKADIDSAFRRIPVAADQRQYAWVAFCTTKGTFLSEHKSMPCGSISSVHCWDRIGAHFDLYYIPHTASHVFVLRGSLLTAFARRVLHIPIMRYVDDFFSAERKESARQSMEIFARLVKYLK